MKPMCKGAVHPTVTAKRHNFVTPIPPKPGCSEARNRLIRLTPSKTGLKERARVMLSAGDACGCSYEARL
eukprot:978562-Amphidinium_carterae.1